MSTHLGTMLAGFSLRAIQVVVESSLYLLIGFLTAGVLRVMVRPAQLERLFRTGRWTGPASAWVIGMVFLPVCALGVLPILRELRRAGVSRPALLTFALATPMLNPISLVYGISYMGPNLLATLIFGSLLISVGVGVAWGYLRPEEVAGEVAEEQGSVPAVGLRRVAAAAAHAAREATGPSGRDVAAGILGAGLIASLFTAPYLAASMFAGDPMAVARMAVVAPLSYVTPDQAVAIIPEMVKFRQSSGAMLVLLALGAGMTLGHLSWLSRSFGVRAAALVAGLAVTLCLAVTPVADRVLPPVGTANVDNDHFAILANPLEGEGLSRLPAATRRYLEGAGAFRAVTCGGLLALICAGLILRAMGDRGRIQSFLQVLPPDEAGRGDPARLRPWERPLPPRLLGGGSAVVLLGLAVVGAYAYFPSPDEAFQDMKIIKADLHGDLAIASSPAAPLHHLDLWERQAEKLPVGALIRLRPPSPEARRRTQELQEGLRALRAAVESGDLAEAKRLFRETGASNERCREAYSPH